MKTCKGYGALIHSKIVHEEDSCPLCAVLKYKNLSEAEVLEISQIKPIYRQDMNYFELRFCGTPSTKFKAGMKIAIKIVE